MLNSPISYSNIRKEIHSFLEQNSFNSIFILVDENTKTNCLLLLPDLPYQLIEIESGEKNKNLDTCQFIWSKLLKNKADRSSLLINLGGGVISDIGGFCASTYKRGIAFINIPTTLLAMVDATIGGKTGIDFQNQKNMLGLFAPAKAIFIDPIFLETLDNRQVNSGKAEMLKHGLIADEEHYKAILQSETPSLELIQESIAIKKRIVDQDPYEKGLRKSLNFGHTLGHALESHFLNEGKDLLHGEAVIQGMIWAISLSVNHCNFPVGKAEKIITALQSNSKKIVLSELDKKCILELVKNDKKNNLNSINFCLLETIENPIITIALSEKDIFNVL